MIKRLTSMGSLRRISLASVDTEEHIDDGFVPFQISEIGIKEVSVVACERKNNVLLFSLESKEAQRTWRNNVSQKTLELFALSLSHKETLESSKLLFSSLGNPTDVGDVATETARENVERWLNSLLVMKLSSGEINQLYCVLMERFAQVHETDEYMKRIDSPHRIPGQHIIKTGYVTKLGGNKHGGQGNWKRRYLVLGEDLRYYLSEEDFLKKRDPKGIISLSSYFVTESESPNALFEFTVYTIPFPFTCRADSAPDLLSWIETLRFAQGLL